MEPLSGCVRQAMPDPMNKAIATGTDLAVNGAIILRVLFATGLFTLCPFPPIFSTLFKPKILLAIPAQPAVNGSAERGSNDRADPEKPKLLNGPSAYKKCDSGAAGRVDGCIGDRNADQMYQGEAQPDSDGRQLQGRTLVGGAMDDH